jgi:hypothetical protein
MNLDVYRACSFKEKRDVLGAFWSAKSEPTPRIGEAALQYGYYAVLCLGVVIVELAFILIVAINHGSFVAWLSAVAEAFVVWSTWWAVRRYQALKTRFAS